MGPAGGTISPQSCAQAYASAPMVAIGDGVQLYLADGPAPLPSLARANGATLTRRGRRRYCLRRPLTARVNAANHDVDFWASPGSAAARRHSTRYLCCASSDGRPLLSGGDPPIGEPALSASSSRTAQQSGYRWRNQCDGRLRGQPRHLARHDQLRNDGQQDDRVEQLVIIGQDRDLAAMHLVSPNCRAYLLGQGRKGGRGNQHFTVQATGGSTFDGSGSAIINVPRGGYGFQCTRPASTTTCWPITPERRFGGGPIPCGALQADFSVSTGCNAVTLPMTIR